MRGGISGLVEQWILYHGEAQIHSCTLGYDLCPYNFHLANHSRMNGVASHVVGPFLSVSNGSP